MFSKESLLKSALEQIECASDVYERILADSTCYLERFEEGVGFLDALLQQDAEQAGVCAKEVPESGARSQVRPGGVACQFSMVNRFMQSIHQIVQDDFGATAELSMDARDLPRQFYRVVYQVEAEDFGVFQKVLCWHYVKQLLWSNAFIQQGIVSWQFAYPYDFGPFASDLLAQQFQLTAHSLDPFQFEMGAPPPAYQYLHSIFSLDDLRFLPPTMQQLLKDAPAYSCHQPPARYSKIFSVVLGQAKYVIPPSDADAHQTFYQTLNKSWTDHERQLMQVKDSVLYKYNRKKVLSIVPIEPVR